ncbi:hypothetical protein Hanom_Chr07g00634971 [Helianthus anomalus]
MNNDPLVKKTAPNWKKSEQNDPDEALKFKRMRAELVAADYWSARSIARWSKLNVEETYKKLKELRAKDPTIPKKPVYPPTLLADPNRPKPPKSFSYHLLYP